jgi:hypothetical protein
VIPPSRPPGAVSTKLGTIERDSIAQVVRDCLREDLSEERRSPAPSKPDEDF